MLLAPLADFRGHCQVAQVAGWPFGRHRESDGGDAEDCDAAFEIFADSCLPGAISTAWVVPVVWTDLIAVIETHDFVNIWHWRVLMTAKVVEQGWETWNLGAVRN
jgi:hypothetical protein